MFGSGVAQVRFASCLVRICTLVFSPCFRFLVFVSRSEELSLSKSRDITSQTWVPLRESSVPSTSMVVVWLRLDSFLSCGHLEVAPCKILACIEETGQSRALIGRSVFVATLWILVVGFSVRCASQLLEFVLLFVSRGICSDSTF